MRHVQNLLPIEGFIYSAKEHGLCLPNAQFVPTCSKIMGCILWLFGQAVFLTLQEKSSFKTVFVRKDRVLDLLKTRKSDEHIGRQFAEKIYSLLPQCRQDLLAKNRQVIQEEVEKVKHALDGFISEEIKEDILRQIDHIRKEAEHLLRGQIDVDLIQAIVDTAKLELRFLVLEVEDLKKMGMGPLPPLSLSPEENEWHEKLNPYLFTSSVSLKSIRSLIKEGAKKHFLNQKTTKYFRGTLLHGIAKIERSDKDLIPFLVSQGADLSSQDVLGNTPLLWAIANACNGNARSLLLLSKRGAAHINRQDAMPTSGNTALHLAIAKGYTTRSATGQKLACPNKELVSLLIEKGADLNRQNALGNTPLHLASARRDLVSIRALLTAGADASIKNTEGKQAKELLSLSYPEARALMEKTASFFSLDETAFESSLSEAQALFGEPK